MLLRCLSQISRTSLQARSPINRVELVTKDGGERHCWLLYLILQMLLLHSSRYPKRTRTRVQSIFGKKSPFELELLTEGFSETQCLVHN